MSYDQAGRLHVSPEDVLARILAEADTVRAGENSLYVEAEIDLSDDEMELVLEMLDEQAALKAIREAEPDGE